MFGCFVTLHCLSPCLAFVSLSPHPLFVPHQVAVTRVFSQWRFTVAVVRLLSLCHVAVSRQQSHPSVENCACMYGGGGGG